MTLPAGTVTFAFTDIVGSTVRWERDRSSMQEALRRHDAILREAIGSNGGSVFKTVGDAFCAAFPRPEAAVAALVRAQRSLAREDFTAVGGLMVRAALHTGTADERDGDYFGPVVNRVARLLAIAQGGQILVSGVTSDLLAGTLPPQTSLLDLGQHRLKDLARPERVYQVVAPGLVATFAPLRSHDVVPNNLPLQLTSFVGREREVAEILRLLAAQRLVTVVGTGGVGKTRALVQAGARLLDGSHDGVWMIELAPLAHGEYLPVTVAQALGLTLPGSGEPLESLVAALRGRRALLLLDNCEHLIEAAARTVSGLLRGCPELRLLVSSRQALGIAGEATYRMPSLAVPQAVDEIRVAGVAARFPAMGLFVDRAVAAKDTFELTDENVAVVGEICRRLDGIPLAIELAAARIKMLSPRQLRDRLDERFRVLTGGSRDVLPRQQTLRALIDWSYDLLDEPERVAFRRLGIFVESFTLDGATAVCNLEADEIDLFDALASLVDKSLVLAEPAADTFRYRMLESTRAYAREKLAAANEHAIVATQHLRYFRDLFVAALARWSRSGRATEFEELLDADLDDVRAALDWAATGDQIVLGAELLATLGRGLAEKGSAVDEAARCERFIAALGEEHPGTRSRLWSAAARISIERVQTGTLEATGRAVALAREAQDAEALGLALSGHAKTLSRAREFELAAAALAEAEACVPAESVALHLSLLETEAFYYNLSGQLEAAGRSYERMQRANQQLGNVHSAGAAAINLADNHHSLGRTQDAVTVALDVLPELREGSNRNLLPVLLANLAGYLIALDRLAEARDIAREALHEAPEQDRATYLVTGAIEHLALVFALEGDLARAARLAAYTDVSYQRVGYRREFTEQATRTRLGALLADTLPAEERLQLYPQGEALSPDEAIALALRT